MYDLITSLRMAATFVIMMFFVSAYTPFESHFINVILVLISTFLLAYPHKTTIK